MVTQHILDYLWTKVIVKLDHSLKKKLFSGSILFSCNGLHSDKQVIGRSFAGVLFVCLARENTEGHRTFFVCWVFTPDY